MLKPSSKYRYVKALKFDYKKYVVLFIALACLCIVTSCTVALYSHYGPLTPNGNRYYHSFNMDTVVWRLVVIAFFAMASLVYPSIRYGLTSNSELRGGGIFPTQSNIFKWIGRILTVLCVGSQILYTSYFYVIVHEYLSNHSRVMAEDLETGLQYLAYLGCIAFWGILNTIYTVIYKFKW